VSVRIGSLIQYLVDKDIGIVVGFDTDFRGEDYKEAIVLKVWWMNEYHKYGHSATRFLFEPDGDTEIVLRY